MYQPAFTITHDLDPHHNQQRTPPERPGGVSSLFPAARGVVEFRSREGQTLLLAATGNLREFIAQRLNEANEPSARADLAPVTGRILAHPTGSAFESDLFVLERSRSADPELYAKITHQNRRSLLLLDPRAGTWRVTETTDPQCQAPEVMIGPCLTNKAAQQLGEALDDVYELCRFPKQLALAPRGTPCAYKEMGRCPGACDGSEPLDDYHARFADAVDAACGGIDAWAAKIERDMHRASGEMDFEAAARSKRQLETSHGLPRDTLAHAASLHELSCIIVTPAARTGWAVCWVFNASGCQPICSIGLLDNELLESLPVLFASHCCPMGFGQVQLDRFSLIARHWLTKPGKQRKRRVSILDTRISGWGKQLRPAIDAAQSASDPGHDDEEHTLLPV